MKLVQALDPDRLPDQHPRLCAVPFSNHFKLLEAGTARTLFDILCQPSSSHLYTDADFASVNLTDDIGRTSLRGAFGDTDVSEVQRMLKEEFLMSTNFNMNAKRHRIHFNQFEMV